MNARRAGSSATDGLYRISFQDPSRPMTLAVVETLLNTFVEQTLGSKRSGQESAQRFLDDEISELRARLTEAESAARRLQETATSAPCRAKAATTSRACRPR